MDVADLDLGQLRERQVKVLSRALSQFVSLKSSPEGWQPVALDNRLAQTASMGGDVDVHIGKKPLPAPTAAAAATATTTSASASAAAASASASVSAAAVGDASIIGGDVYRMTASIPLDPDVSKDTQGPFSAYLSELRDWQAVLECPGLRSMWNYYIRSCSTLEMLDAHTSITRAELRSPIPGQSKEFAHQRDMMMVETSLVDPTTVVYVSTSLPTTEDDPVYLRERAPFKRAHSALWAWCVEIVTPPIDAIPQAAHAMAPGFGASQQLLRATAAASSRAKPRVCVQVTCFLHLDLNSSWKSNNALACRAAANLIPSLVAHLRLHGVPPRIARIGPSIAVDRSEWHRPAGDTPVWEVSYSVMCTPYAMDVPGSSKGRCHESSDAARLPPPLLQSRSSAMSVGQPIIASILDLETASSGVGNGRESLAPRGAASSLHTRKVSTLTSYLSSSFQRRQGEVSSAFGTHAGGIVRDGEEISLVVTRARLGSCVLEFVVDASKWHNEGQAVDIALTLSGFSSAEQLFTSISEMQAAAPELFTESQLRLTHDDVAAMMTPKKTEGGVYKRHSHHHHNPRKQHQHQQQQQQKVIAELAAMQLVRCFSLPSHKNTRLRYLVRILNPPSTDERLSAGHERLQPEIEESNGSTKQSLDGESVDRTYRVAVVVQKGAIDDSINNSNSRATGLVVNGFCAEVMPFTLDPPTYSALKPRTRASSNDERMLHKRASTPAPRLAVPERSSAPRLESAVAEMTPDVYTGDTTDECIAAPAMELEDEEGEDIEGTHSTMEMNNNGLQAINRESANASAGAEDMADICDIPLARLRHVSRVPAGNWISFGTSAAGGIAISRTDVRAGKEQPVLRPRQQQQQNRVRLGDSDSDANDTAGSSVSLAIVADRGSISGTVLRAEALVEGWTIFDVFSVLCIGNGPQEHPVSGLWSASQILEQLASNAELHHRKTSGTWATAARDAVVCRVWTTSSRSNRIDVAECSVDEFAKRTQDMPDTTNAVRAELGLSAWRLEKSKLPPVQEGTGDQPSQQGYDGTRDHERRSGDVVASASAGTRLRSTSTTGSPAIDAEFENQRRKQNVVKITHYLRYNPRGWLSPDGATAAAAGDDMAAGFRRMGAALGLSPSSQPEQQQQQQQQQPNVQSMHDESAVFQTMLLPMLKDAVCSDITRVVQHLDQHGARPAVVWSRNASVVSTDATSDGVQVRYRLAGWGATGSSRPSVAETLEQNEFVEIEVRIEHRVWAHGHRTGGAAERMSPASIEITAEPFYETSAVACYVDPESDPHATRVRISHHRSQLLPRVEESDGGIFMAWPTVRLAVNRRVDDAKKTPLSTSSLVLPAAMSPSSKRTASSPIAPWSVPPRMSVNLVDARVRYLRRDSTGHAFYARCQSVARRDAARLVCGPPRAGELFMERLLDPVPQQPGASAATAPVQAVSSDSSGDGDDGSCVDGDASRIAIEKYSVHGTGHHRVATPNQFASVMSGVFARIRHELELADPQSARSRWDNVRRQQRDSDKCNGDSDARSVASLVTAIADEGWWSVRGQPGGEHAATYQRVVDGLHNEIPVTVVVDVLQGVSAATVARLLEQPWEHADWDTILFDGRKRREIEYVPGTAGGVGVCYSSVHVPLLCDRRDALTVRATERAAFLPTRRRLRNWEASHCARSAAPSGLAGVAAGCGNSAAALGDCHDPTFTLVEASIPGSQPLSTAVRANVALYAVRVDPIDAFERVVGGRPLALPSCRITIACCVDLAGAMPLPLRRAASARIPGQHIAQMRARLLQPHAPSPLWPLLEAPSRCRRVLPRWAGSSGDSTVAAEVSEQVVDGQRLAFHTTLDGLRVVHEAVVNKDSRKSASYVSVVVLPGAHLHGSAEAKAFADADFHLCSLRKDGDASDSETFPPLHNAGANGDAALSLSAWSLCLIPVVSDVVIDSATSCFPHGFDINVSTSLAASENSQPIAEAVLGNIASACDREPSALGSGKRRRGSSSRVADQAAEIPAARWIGDAGAHCRLAVYVFAHGRDNNGSNPGAPARFLVRTVLLPPDHEDGSAELHHQRTSPEKTGGAIGSQANKRQMTAASCTIVIRAACEDNYAQITAISTASGSTAAGLAALDPLDTANTQNERDMPAVWCNGQRLRVHEAMPPKQSLLFVATTEGEYLDACHECGGFRCDAHKASCANSSSDSDSNGVAVVGYASDTDEVILHDGGGLAAAEQQDADNDDDVAGDRHELLQHMDIDKRQYTAPMLLAGDGGQSSPPLAVTAAAPTSSLVAGQGLLGATLRRRIAGVSSRNSSTSAGLLTATDNDGSTNPTNTPSSFSVGMRRWRTTEAEADPDKVSSHWTADIAGWIPVKRVVFAAFLPVRRLVIGRVSTGSSEPAGAVSVAAVATRKSVLALVLILVAAGVCVLIGMRVCELLVIAHLP
ncbi:hypothetical protein IW140_005865 [Coemansia sp. RSA 1813]|nr:hypothetical protein IW138_005892 [Coemansia sp. RSA 986]KAJ2210887.1 hypothetical protein EV179_005910 [Coemansia sp. RSA 487]KAJ2564084.1 hypothetical protein IW140_005865 [Coemansia sp. RSA 1813]